MDYTTKQCAQAEPVPGLDLGGSDDAYTREGTPRDPDQIYNPGTQHDSPEDVPHPAVLSDNQHIQDQELGEQNESYVPFLKGFSDDEDTEPFDWANHRSGKSSSNSKKSPRRSHDGSDQEQSPSTKKPRRSLFGGPSEEYDQEEPGQHPAEQDEQEEFDQRSAEHDGQRQADQHLVEEEDGMIDMNAPGRNIGYRMSSLNLDEQDTDRSLSERPFNLGFGLNSPGRDRASPRASPALSEDSVIIPQDTQPAYKLRTNIERKKAFTWIDNDKSGNFDPTEEAKQKAHKMNKARALKAAQQKKGKGKARSPKENVLKCIVKLRFNAFGNVRNYTNDEDNWPDGWSDIDSECERELEEYRAFFRHNTPERERQPRIEDPSGEVDDLTGYPAARGCRSCRNHDQTCSMTEDGTYPCDFCAQDHRICEPILPPKVKGDCKQCIEDGEVCSFSDDPNQSACENCAMHEYICDALPPKGHTSDRIFIDDLIYGEDRPFASCTACRSENKRCSLRKKTDKPPCKHCKKNHIGCTFYEFSKPAQTGDKAAGKKKVLGPTGGEAPEVAVPGSNYFTAADLEDLKRQDDDHSSREVTPEVEMEDKLGHRGLLTKIKTCFAHPIRFGGLINDVPDCEFCDIPSFGFLGYFEKEVHVIRWYNGNGFSEVGGGYTEHRGATSMCQDCTMGRAQVLTCDQHELVSMYPNDVGPGFQETLDELLETAEKPYRMRHELQRWCSMCFTPALFACCARQASLFATNEDDEEIEGCGLRLCGQCEVRLREEFGGDIGDMADAMDLEPKAMEDDEDLDGHLARADVGFFSRDGLLMRSLGQEAEELDL